MGTTLPIGRRVRNAVLLAILVTLVCTIAATYVVSESLEDSVLQLDLEAERDFLLEHNDRSQALAWDTATLKALYEPDGQLGKTPLPDLFKTLPVPFAGEVVHKKDGMTYLVTTYKVNGGRLFLAKNISLFEHRQNQFGQFLAGLAVVLVALGILSAWLISRRLTGPLRQLSDFIGHTAPAPRMPRLSNDFRDAELSEIADTFNLFLNEMEQYVKHEQMLLSLASHELRTPIAVIAGALDVVEERGNLREEDARTVARMRRAVEEMRENIDLILRLTRRRSALSEAEVFELEPLAREVLDDLQRSVGGSERVVAETVGAGASMCADRTLVKMLLRNLVQNALQHSEGLVVVRLGAECIEVADAGGGLTHGQQALLRGETVGLGNLSGLGLFIVTLGCERLGWRLSVPRSSAQGTTIRLDFGARSQGDAVQ